ncbi:metallophosphoesterase family protein [Deinococcus budaensis]|uniref:Diadenosine tetraphosphatase ApaH/serine/threonine PP2A family protein phosphatase n=1 Tax=Deinococcus budaensis TaxID=1665626 RepID=A0A7W8GI26_9DEIO|nr:diadenosine tetraphosphatase ApaH/serine/threonine PP2A family protein phosphatase [Deinococcus budaensis]
MRLLLLSDIHANHTALEAVLADARPRGFDRTVHLGDALGYGPQPREVLAALRELEATCLLGNHEQMLLAHARGRPGRWAELRPGSVVLTALLWQLGRLSRADLAWVGQWPDGLDDPAVGARYRHGTPVSLDAYTDSVTAAREAFGAWSGRLAFVGHTHVPGVYSALNAPVGEWVKFQALREGGAFVLPPGSRVILNPGSVGQPRDGNPDASYAIFDSAAGVFGVFRVPYDIGRAQTLALEAGLPPVLAARLALGK